MKSALMRCNAERHRSISAKKSVRNALLLGGWRLLSLSLSTSLVSASLVSAAPPTKRAAEMEFDARVIQGQRAEGAVYLFQRAQRPLPPLLSFKRDYLGAITRPVLGVNTPASEALTPSTLTQGAAFVVRPYADVNAQEATQKSPSNIRGEGTQEAKKQVKQPQKAQEVQKAQRKSPKRTQRKGIKARQQAKRKQARKGRSGR